jgi:hypothetical protein
MGFLDDRPIAKIVSGAILVVTTSAYVFGIVPAENSDVLTILIGGAMGFLFGSSVSKKV